MKIILSQDYPAMIEDQVSDRYYRAISAELEFLNYYPNDNSFSIVLVGGCRVVVPTSGVIFL